MFFNGINGINVIIVVIIIIIIIVIITIVLNRCYSLKKAPPKCCQKQKHISVNFIHADN